MNSPLVPLALLIMKVFTNNGNAKPVVVEYHEPRPGIETQAKCHLHYQWTNVDPGYTMTCVECSSVPYVTVYHQGTAVGAATVDKCDSYNVITSVRVVPGQGGAHSLEYHLKAGRCVGVDYQGRKVTERECSLKIDVDKELLRKGYLNGWRQDEIPKSRGVVRDVNDMYKESKRWCMKMETWEYKEQSLVLRCFECPKEYVAIVYKGKTPVGAAAVETCKTNLLEYSISIDPRGSDRRVRVQYQMNAGRCERKRYELGEDGTYRKIDRDNCVDISPLLDYKRFMGYRNGWKKKIQSKAKRAKAQQKKV